ncbi:DMT family transporter [Saccharopolyspora mangrovi]|uniref:SMR family transporter n=1 Tax=Saccharopolyspora mangrovi TaxID=3082379 RepID=A0ABU6AFG2_9PSEU|nr:SMR family transporter [Saccharopolyspora sp. S2-29]MEB3370250.1 SMR family transporter [Saccharopolyspora sp. S2-29]
MHWLHLGIAVIFEITVAISAGKAQGFTNAKWTTATLVSGGIATYFLSLALLTFDVGIGYAVWAGIGAAGAALLGPLFFDESLTAAKAVWLAVIIAGVVWLKLADSPERAGATR